MPRVGIRTLAVGYSLFWLASGSLEANDFPATQKTLGVPASIATVIDANTSNLPQYILIQDIHRHPEVQGHIAALLMHIHARWGVQNVFIEGAFSYVDPSRFETLGTGNRVRLVDLIRQGVISGAEMAAAMAPRKDLHLMGLEDPDVYKENLAAWDRMEKERDSALAELRTIRFLQNTLDLSSTQFSSDQLDHLELLLKLKMKPAEYADYVAARTDIAFSPVLAQAIETAETFYELANERSRIFLERAAAAECDGPRVLVVGGFHTTAMAASLRAQHKTYAVLSPQVTESGYDALYAQRLHESVSALKVGL